MLRLLRRFRRRFIETSSFKKYALYAVGEVILIVIGVLIAAELNNLNSFRVNRIHAKKMLERIDGELTSSMQRIASFEGMIRRKERALLSIVAPLNGKSIDDPEDFIDDVLDSARFGWEQPTLEQTTFEEVVSSGRLSLILDTELRLSITRFFHTVKQREERSMSRISEFPKIAYKLIPREREPSLQEGLSSEEIDAIVENILASELRDYVIPELNRARFMISIWDDMRSEAIELQNRIRSVRGMAELDESTSIPAIPSTGRQGPGRFGRGGEGDSE